MDYVFVLEEDPLYRRQIQKAITDINPLLSIKFYHDLEEFYNWIKEIIAQGNRPWSEEGEKETNRVRLVISRCEFIGHDRLELLVKVRDLFTRRNMCTAQEPVGFVLTAFDDPSFHIAKYQHPILSNVLFKPFDELILREHLSYALAGRTVPKSVGLSHQKAETAVEMLKPVEMESLTDIGFTSRSNRSFEVGHVSKYYGEPFVGEKVTSVFARLVSCQPHPQYPSEFQLDFHFYGNDANQITAIRKRLRTKDRYKLTERKPPKANLIDNPLFVLIEPRDSEFEALSGTLRRKVRNANIVRFNSLKLFEEELGSPSKARSGILSTTVYGFEMSREFVVTKCEPEEALLWGEPLKGLNLGRFIPAQELKPLGLWMMGNQPETMVLTQNTGHSGVLQFQRSNGKVQISEPDLQARLKFLRSRRSVKQTITAVIVNGRDFSPENLGAWENMKKAMSEELSEMPACYVISERIYTDEQKKLLAPYFDDIFYSPVDRAYFIQKMVFRFPGLKILEDPVQLSEKKMPAVIKTANPVEVEELSEAAMTMDYYREISAGSFREFVLWQPYDYRSPQLLGSCYACEPKEGKDAGYKVYFVLYGMRDQLLKAIRLWIRDNYVNTKNKAS